MKAKRIREIRDILESSAFQNWFQRYSDVQTAIRQTQERRQELLADANMVRFRADSTQRRADDKLFQAGEFENRSVEAEAEFAQIENDSFETLSAFEVQRQATTQSWMETSAAEKVLEDERQRSADLRAKLGASSSGELAEGDAETLKSLDKRIEVLAREAQRAREKLEQEAARRDALWENVQAAWSQSFRANMARTEYLYRARRMRREAEQGFAFAEKEKQRADALEQQADASAEKLVELRQQFQDIVSEAEAQFGCALIEEFLYWARSDDVDAAICVPLIEDREHLNIQIAPLHLYQADRKQGLDFLEPVPDEVDSGEEDPRLEAFFREGRPTQPKPVAASS